MHASVNYASVKHTNICSDNGLSLGRRQSIVWTNAGMLLIVPLGRSFSEFLIEIYAFSFKKMHLKIFGKWRPFSLQWRHNGHDGVSNHWPDSRLFLNFCLGADQRKHQSYASLAFVRANHRWPVDSPHKGPVQRKMFPFDDVIMCLGLNVLSQGNIWSHVTNITHH